MKAFIQKRIKQSESWFDLPAGEPDWEQLAPQFKALLREIELHALEHGHPGVVAACQQRGSGPRHARRVLAACLAACTTSEAVESEFLTVKQASEKYNLGERTIYRMVEQGMPVSRAGRSIRIKPSDLQRHLEDDETVFK